MLDIAAVTMSVDPRRYRMLVLAVLSALFTNSALADILPGLIHQAYPVLIPLNFRLSFTFRHIFDGNSYHSELVS